MEKRKITVNNVWKLAMPFIFAWVMLLCLPGIRVEAGGGLGVDNKFKETVTLTADSKKNGDCFGIADVAYGTYKNVKVTSSNKSVATVKKLTDDSFLVFPKKAGTIKVTWTAKNKTTNKTIKRTGTIRVVKFQNPFSTLKFGGKNYTSKIKTDTVSMNGKTSKTKLKLQYKLKSGWKIQKTSYFYNFVPSTGKSTTAALKNGKTYTVKKNSYVTLQIQVKNSKTGARSYVTLNLNQ